MDISVLSVYNITMNQLRILFLLLDEQSCMDARR